MTDITCTFNGDRESTLIAYLYDDIDPAARAAFDTHLPGCARCRRELAALGGVRRGLASWTPPALNPQSAIRNPQSPPSPWYRQLPVWAQVAAALLFLGVSAGVANLDVHYDASGLSIRTGRSRAPNPTNVASATPLVNQIRPVKMVTEDQLSGLEQRLRVEMHTIAASEMSQAPRTISAGDAETLRRARALVEESEKRQQAELALRVAQVLRDVDIQRQTDLSKIDRSLGLIQTSTGVEILKQRENINYLMRVSQRP